MRIAIFSDVHGNLTAFEAVLTDIEQRGADEIVFAGDLCLMGARPQECVELLRQRDDILALYGNTDEMVDSPPLLSRDIEEEERRRWQLVHDVATWTRESLSEMNRAWLRELPFHRRFSPTVQPQDDLFIVHANPVDVHQVIHPPLSMQQQLYGEIKQSDEDLHSLLGDLITGVLAFGHLHIPSIRTWNDITLLNVSSVSMPGDGDPRAKYALLEWDGARWQIEQYHVEYDIEREVEAYRQKQPPSWQQLAQTLRPE